MLDVILIPDFVNHLVLEGKYQDLKDLQMLVNASGHGNEQYFNCCIPRRIRDPYLYNQKMEKLE